MNTLRDLMKKKDEGLRMALEDLDRRLKDPTLSAEQRYALAGPFIGWAIE